MSRACPGCARLGTLAPAADGHEFCVVCSFNTRNPEHTVRVVAGLLADPDARVPPFRYLVGRRAGARDYVGCWEFPGGKVEPGEDDVAALRREWEEELGVRVDVGPELAAWSYEGADRRVDIALRWVSLAPGSDHPAPKGSHDCLRYLEPAEAAALPKTTPSTVPLCAALARRPPT